MVHDRVMGCIAICLAAIDQVALDLRVWDLHDFFRVAEYPDGLHAYKC